jgi:chemosensory pili system protein ChpA (sensor histidine kinase/response regulator)
MVGLDRFADAGAALERVMNVWLSEARSATPDLLALLDSATAEMRDWVAELVASGRSARTGEAVIEAATRVQEGQAFAGGAADTSNVLTLDLPAFDLPAADLTAIDDPVPDLSAIDIAAMDLPATDTPAAELPALDIPGIEALDFDDLDLLPEQHPELAPAGNVIEFPAPVEAAQALDDNIKRIGDIDIPLPLHAIYLAETDEIVRVLLQDFSEWHHEPQRAVSTAALKASHTLTGTSATVGFKTLRDVAYALEMALKTLVAPAPVLNDGQRALIEATLEQVRTMLQEFAVGVPSAPQPDLVEQLQILREQLAQQEVDHPESGLEVDEALDERLDILFGATLAAIALDPPVQPPAEAEVDDGPHPVSAADDIDNLFDVAFDDPFEEPTLTQAVPPMEHLDIASLPSLDLDDELAPELVPEPEPEASMELLAVPEPEPEILMDLDLVPDPEPAPEPEPEVFLELAPEPEREVILELAPEPKPEVIQAVAPVTELEPWVPAVAPQAPAAQQLAPADTVALAPAYTDDLDPDLLPVFLEEANDLLPEIGNAVRAWQHNPADTAPAQSLLRALHTVKGSARMAGAMRLGQHVHEIESQVENMVHAGTSTSTAFDELVSNYDIALQLHDQLLNPGSAPALAAPGQPASAAVPAASLAASPVSAQAEAQSRVPVVRVRADILDRLVNQAGEVSITRSKLENQVGTIKAALGEFSDNLDRLRNQLREVEMQAETQIASRTSTSTDRGFDPLEFDRFTRLQELTRMMAESVSDVASVHDSLSRTVDGANEDLAMQSRLTRDLQQDLMRVRMVPFSSVSERLFRVARQCAKEVDKRVNLDIRGGSVEVDRSVLEQMVAPFEHLLRNAIVHGIESRAARSAGGKSETGELLIQASGQGNEVVIEFQDDGAGLDLKRIRAKATQAGLLQPGIDVTDAQAAELIFEPGFSTADTLTELAGRGVGMDVVRSEAQALGGRVEIQTDAGKGARFSIHLPLTLAVTQVVLIASAGKTYAVPSILVEQVLQLKEQVVRDAHLAGSLVHQGQPLPLAYLAGLLGDRAAHPMSQRSVPVLVLRSGADRMAIHVDTVIGNREVVIKNVGPQLARMAGIAGATVLGSGDIVLILNPVALMHHANQNPLQHKAEQQDAALATQQRDLVVMVVDDSLTVRKVTQRLLEREGYRVMLAKDGVDALEQLQQTLPDLMLVDIEMPRMDGFDLTRNIRAHQGTQAIPIIMITSRTADKHRNLARELGVNAYFGKPFQEDALQAEISKLLGKEAVV